MNVAKNPVSETKTRRWQPPFSEIGDRFKLMQKGRSDVEMERLSGVSSNVIAKCREGKHTPNISLMAYYCLHEGYSLDWIVLGIDRDNQGGMKDDFVPLLSRVLCLPFNLQVKMLVALSLRVQEYYGSAEAQAQARSDRGAELLAGVSEWQEQDSEEAIKGIQQGLDDFEIGRFRNFQEFAEEQRLKYNLPTDS